MSYEKHLNYVASEHVLRARTIFFRMIYTLLK